MKIEKINDNQIKCTLNKSDLASRQIKLSELAYGSEKAKSLFRDMMQQASCELGFEAEDIPLMIEAIPVSGDCIVLLITKVEDPEELDTRFSKFAPAVDDIEEIDDQSKLPSPGGILDMLGQVKDEIKEALERARIPLFLLLRPYRRQPLEMKKIRNQKIMLQPLLAAKTLLKYSPLIA